MVWVFPIKTNLICTTVFFHFVFATFCTTKGSINFSKVIALIYIAQAYRLHTHTHTYKFNFLSRSGSLNLGYIPYQWVISTVRWVIGNWTENGGQYKILSIKKVPQYMLSIKIFKGDMQRVCILKKNKRLNVNNWVRILDKV